MVTPRLMPSLPPLGPRENQRLVVERWPPEQDRNFLRRRQVAVDSFIAMENQSTPTRESYSREGEAVRASSKPGWVGIWMAGVLTWHVSNIQKAK